MRTCCSSAATSGPNLPFSTKARDVTMVVSSEPLQAARMLAAPAVNVTWGGGGRRESRGGRDGGGGNSDGSSTSGALSQSSSDGELSLIGGRGEESSGSNGRSGAQTSVSKLCPAQWSACLLNPSVASVEGRGLASIGPCEAEE